MKAIQETLEDVYRALQALLESYSAGQREQQQLSLRQEELWSRVTARSRDITQQTKALQEIIRHTDQVGKNQEELHHQLKALEEGLKEASRPRPPIVMNGWLLVIAALCMISTIAISWTKIFDYKAAAAAAERRARDYYIQHYICIDKDSFSIKKTPKGGYVLVPVKNK